MASGTSVIEIDAPIGVVFAHAADFEAMPQWQPDVQVVEILERDADGRAICVYTELETVIRRAEATLSISYDEPASVSWRMVKGNVPKFEGAWLLRELADERTQAEYRVKIDFGRLGILARGPMMNALKGAAVSSLPAKLKQHVESRPTAQRDAA